MPSYIYWEPSDHLQKKNRNRCQQFKLYTVFRKQKISYPQAHFTAETSTMTTKSNRNPKAASSPRRIRATKGGSVQIKRNPEPRGMLAELVMNVRGLPGEDKMGH